MQMNIDLVDVIILVLLITGLAYVIILTRRLDKLKRVLHEIAPVLQAYVRAVDRSESVARVMSRTAEQVRGSEVTRNEPRVKQGAAPTKNNEISNFYSKGAVSR